MTGQMNSSQWDSIDEALRRLEQRWRSEGCADLAQFIPGPDDQSRQEILVALIPVDQEYRWNAGQRKSLEQYLAEWPELAEKRERIGELLEAECRLRSDCNDLPTREELQVRFPEIHDRINLTQINIRRTDSSLRRHTQGTTSGIHAEPGSRHRMQPSSAPTILRIGQQFGRYLVRRVLGQGGMGVVYEAHDGHLDRAVAIKVPLLDPEDEFVVLNRFLREGRMAARVHHPNICPIYDAARNAKSTTSPWRWSTASLCNRIWRTRDKAGLASTKRSTCRLPPRSSARSRLP